MWGVLPKGDRDAGQARGPLQGRGQNMFGTRYYYAATRGVGGKRLRAALLASSALVAAGSPAVAQDATWLFAPGSGNFNTGANWDTATVPTGTAFFNTSGTTALSFSASASFDGWTFNPGASAYNFTNASQTLQFTGAGIVVNGGSATITNNYFLEFYDTSTAGNATITNNSLLQFYDTSTVGSATITNNFFLQFHNTSTAGSATITNNGFLFFYHNSTAGSAALVNNAGGLVDFSDSTGPNGDGKLSAGSIAGAGRYVLGANELTVGSNNLSTEVGGVIAGTGSLVKTGIGTLTLSGANTYTGGTTINGGTLQLGSAGGVGSILGAVTVGSGGAFGVVNADTSGITSIISSGSTFFLNSNSAGNALINNFGLMNFNNTSTAGNATITNSSGGSLAFNHTSTAGSATITNNGALIFATPARRAAPRSSTAAVCISTTPARPAAPPSPTTASLDFYNTSTAGNATITNNGGGTLNFKEHQHGRQRHHHQRLRWHAAFRQHQHGRQRDHHQQRLP